MVTTIEKLQQLLDLAEDFGGRQFREDLVSLVIVPRIERPPARIPVYLDLVYGSNVPEVLTCGWLNNAINSFEEFHGHEPDGIKVSTAQQRRITEIIFVPPTCPATKVTHYNGIPLMVIAHCREDGGITG
jgi:hypothetical protein